VLIVLQEVIQLDLLDVFNVQKVHLLMEVHVVVKVVALVLNQLMEVLDVNYVNQDFSL